MRSKYKLFNVPIYNKNILVIYADSIEIAKNIFKKRTSMELDVDYFKGLAGSVEFSPELPKLFYVIIIKQKEDLTNIIVHESLHLTQDILEYVGIDFEKGKANEPYTYLLSYIVDNIKNIIKNG